MKLDHILGLYQLSINCPIKGTSKNGFGFSVFILRSLSSKISVPRERKNQVKKSALKDKRPKCVCER